MKKRIEWAALIVIGLLILLGVLLPLWLEMRALSGSGPPRSRKRLSALDVRHAFYCPVCGEEISLRLWRHVPLRQDRRPPVLRLATLAAPSWPFIEAPLEAPETRSVVHD